MCDYSNYAFIDSQNLNLAIRDQGWKLDFRRFRIYLNDKYRVKKAFVFIGYLRANSALYTALNNWGYQLIFKPVLVLPDGKIKGNVDAELVLHVMLEYNNFAKAVIVTGDGDFHCLVDHLNSKGKLLKIIIPDRNRYSSLLREFFTASVFMNDLKRKLEYK